jgi:ketosteroid isomerase-like protein
MSTPLTLVQTAYAAFGRGDIPGLLSVLAPDVRWEFTGDSQAPSTTRH